MDDSKATNVDAMYAGLMVLKELKAVVLLGGLAKVTALPYIDCSHNIKQSFAIYTYNKFFRVNLIHLWHVWWGGSETAVNNIQKE